MGDAADLIKQIKSLDRVQPEHRAGFIHDKIVSAVDDICDKHKGVGGSVFNSKQMLAIKDIAYQIVFIVDKNNMPPTGIFRRNWSEFKAYPLSQKIGMIGSLLAIAGAIGGFSIAVWSSIHRIPTSTEVVEMTNATPPAANSPTKSDPLTKPVQDQAPTPP